MKKFYVSLIGILLLISSCSPTKIACVGDSITYGSGIENRDSLSYPSQLQKLLGNNYNVQNFGVSGANMIKKGNNPYWLMPEFEAVKEFKPNIIVLMLGTNDTKTFNWNPYKEDYAIDYNAMLKVFKEMNPKTKFYIGLPPPIFENRWSMQKDVLKFEMLDIIKKIASDNHIKTIDFYETFLDKSHLFPDGVHPNAEGAKLMASEIFKVLKN